MWFQKISIPPPRREKEITKGWGVKSQEIPEKMDVNVISEITFSDLLHRQIVAWVFATTIVLHFKQVFYLLKAHWNLTTSQKSSMLFRSFVRQYLLIVTSPHRNITWFNRNALVTSLVYFSRSIESRSCLRKVSYLLAMKMIWWFQKLKNVLFFLSLASLLCIFLLILSFFFFDRFCDVAITFMMNVINIFKSWIESG